MSTELVRADEVQEGDFIPGLDNAYVPWVPEHDERTVTILFHDAQGDEGTLTCAEDMPITIERK